MRIRCVDCGHSEEVSVDLFVKIIGGATAGFGFWAWVTFLFAGTGFALPICIAIATGGAGMLVFKDQIVDWLVNKGYECDNCHAKKWTAVSEEIEKEINEKESKISALQDELGEKENEIEALLKDREEWEKLKEQLLAAQDKIVGNLTENFSTRYQSLNFSSKSLKRIAKLKESERLQLEKELGKLNYNPRIVKFRDDIEGTDLKELEFGNGGRVYVRKEGSQYLVACVGNKNSQNTDLKTLKKTYKHS